LLTLLLVGAVALVAVTTFSGISLKGGFGDVTIVPSTSSVASHYRLGVGELDVNLSNVRFSPSGETVSVNLGVGQVRVEVPSGAVVTVQAHSHIGAATVFGRSGSEIESSSGITTAASRAPHLTLDVRVGVGTIDVTRG
jgi:predicted membrane protein